uniref:uncharacterized protein LOC113179197 isoform X9 n=1 Tax=Urocitellus parryii TaxID=9999 RepID=UPI000E5589BB|nr:uncharacterized protein LOC113179197 isoform X9 [Urocitellus parryii]
MAEKQSHRLQSITPPASPSLPGGNLQGPSGFEGRGQEETLNSGSTEDKERLPYILFLPGFSSSASYPPSPQNKLISLSTTKGNGTRTQRDVYQPLCAEPHLLDAERRAPLPERQLSADCWSRRFHSLRTDEGTKGLYAAHLPELGHPAVHQPCSHLPTSPELPTKDHEGNSSPAGPHPLLRTSRALWAERKPDRDRTPRRQSQPCVCQEPPEAGAHAAGGLEVKLGAALMGNSRFQSPWFPPPSLVSVSLQI